MSSGLAGTACSQPLLIFLHLPKTAGNTMARILERQYGPSAVLALSGSVFGEEISTIPQKRIDDLGAIIGHFYFGVHTLLSRPSIYITMLRDPVDRVISHYYYVRRDPSHYLYPLAQRRDLREYVISCGLAEPNNDQTRLLAGRDRATGDGTCTAEMLPEAKKNLREHFVIVGLTEEFDRSLILMKGVLGWRNPYYLRQNVSRRRSRKEDIPPETIKVIQEYNELDHELYSYAKEHLNARLRLQRDSFEKKLRIFRVTNVLNAMLHAIKRISNH